MSKSLEVVSVNTSAEQGTVKRPVDEIRIDDHGIIGDAHAGPWHRQVSIISQESIDRFAAKANGRFTAGDFAANISVGGMDLSGVAVLDRFRIGEVELEVTQIGKAEHEDTHMLLPNVDISIMLKEGIFCRVIEGGTVRPGDAVTYLPRTLRFRIITMSDRAFRGEYTDKSGPRVNELLEEFLRGTRWHAEIETTILPDNADELRRELAAARDAGVDVVFTTGGTGVGLRDITPETVSGLCDKLIPGIMEAIRLKFGAENPNALLSRGVAGIMGETLIYTLPGSVRAVEEYMGEILTTMEHILFMLHELDVH